MTGTAIFGGPNDIYRYVLTRPIDANAPSQRRLLAVMINPSTADATTNDHTITKLEGFAKLWGFGVLVVVNLFAFRATSVKELKSSLENVIGPRNDFWIAAEAERADDILIAWGARSKNPTRHKSRSALVMGILDDSGKPISCLGRTKCGEPRHPLTLAYATPREML